MLEIEIAAYEQKRAELESDHLGKWVVFKGSTQEGTYDSFQAAAMDAVSRFGRGPFLLRQVGERPVVLPASVVFQSN